MAMKYRQLRDTTDSKRVNILSEGAEILFYRLMMKADREGRYHSDSLLIKNNCFPRPRGLKGQQNALRTSDIDRWLQELSKPFYDEDTQVELPALIRQYTSGGKRLLQISNFGQESLKWEKPLFPPPPDDPPESEEKRSRTDSDIELEERGNGARAQDKIYNLLRQELFGKSKAYYPECAKVCEQHMIGYQKKNGVTDETFKLPEVQKAYREFEESIFKKHIYPAINKDIVDMMTYYGARNFQIDGQPIVNWKSVMTGWMRRKKEGFKKKS